MNDVKTYFIPVSMILVFPNQRREPDDELILQELDARLADLLICKEDFYIDRNKVAYEYPVPVRECHD